MPDRQVVQNSDITVQLNYSGIIPTPSSMNAYTINLPYILTGLTIPATPLPGTATATILTLLDPNGATITPPSTPAPTITVNGVTSATNSYGSFFTILGAADNIPSTVNAVSFNMTLELGLDYVPGAAFSILNITYATVVNNPSTQAYNFPLTITPSAALTSSSLDSISSITNYPPIAPTASTTGSTFSQQPQHQQPGRGTTVTVPVVTIPVTVPPPPSAPIPPNQTYLGVIFTLQLLFGPAQR
jgi:hypothetical protein